MRGVGRDELEAERPHAPFAGLGQRLQLRAGDPERRVRLLQRLRHDHAQRDVPDLARVLAGPVLEHRHDGADRFLEDLALVLHGDAERLELGDRGALAHAELAAPVRQQVERRDPLGDPRRMVGRHLEDAVPQPDVLGPLARRREKRLRGGRVGILFEEVMLDLPRMVVAQPVRQFDLVQRVLIEPMLVAGRPRTGQLQLVEDAKLHGVFLHEKA